MNAALSSNLSEIKIDINGISMLLLTQEKKIDEKLLAKNLEGGGEEKNQRDEGNGEN